MILIWWYISDFFDFIFYLFRTLFWFIGEIVTVLSACVSFLGQLFISTPLIFKASLLALVAISVVYKLLGRESQS